MSDVDVALSIAAALTMQEKIFYVLLGPGKIPTYFSEPVSDYAENLIACVPLVNARIEGRFLKSDWLKFQWSGPLNIVAHGLARGYTAEDATFLKITQDPIETRPFDGRDTWYIFWPGVNNGVFRLKEEK